MAKTTTALMLVFLVLVGERRCCFVKLDHRCQPAAVRVPTGMAVLFLHLRNIQLSSKFQLRFPTACALTSSFVAASVLLRCC
jgi:hypothetical protein